MKTFVSVIIPVYNMELFIAETLQSVLASDYPNFEVIAVDDGSTDASLRILHDWAQKDARLHVFSTKNSGVSHTRNYAVRQSKGTYILPVDADDLIAPSFITEAASLLDKEKDTKVVVPRIMLFGRKEKKWRIPPFSRALLARRNMLPVCCMYRRSDFDRIGGYCEDITAREDWDFWIAMLKDKGKVNTLNNVGYYYRIRPRSKRITDRKRDIETITLLNQRHADFFQRELGGPLRRMRSWSKMINFLTKPWRK